MSANPVKLSLNSLRNGELAAAFPGISLPAYNPENVVPRVFHIGPSNFFFAHMAKKAHDLLNNRVKEGAPLDWGIIAVSLRKDDATRALKGQDGLYTLTSVGAGPTEHEVIGSVRNVMFAKGESISSAIEAAADPNIRIITMTVTESGYARGGPHVWADGKLTGEGETLTTVDLIVHSLNLRKQRGTSVPLIASLDNIKNNGVNLENAVLDCANHLASLGHVDSDLAKWIKDNAPFVSTMVDRITPNTRDDNAQKMLELGVETAWAIKAEHMPTMPLAIQRITDGVKGAVYTASGIEDLSKVGAVFAEDVEPHEKLKVGVLNGAHMALGCIGHQFMDDNGVSMYKDTYAAMQNPAIRNFIVGFMEEVSRVLPEVPGVPAETFRQDVLRRLDNDKMKDPLTRLARNGASGKLEGRILAPILSYSEIGEVPKHATFAFAAWLHYASALDDGGYLPDQMLQKAFKPESDRAASASPATGAIVEKREPNDAKAAELGIPRAIRNNWETIEGVFANTDIVKGPVAQDPRIIAAVKEHFNRIRDCGMETAVQMTFGTGIPAVAAHNKVGGGDRGHVPAVHQPVFS